MPRVQRGKVSATFEAREAAGCGSLRLLRALDGTRILQAAAPTAPPCFGHWPRSSPLQSVRGGHSKSLLLFFGQLIDQHLIDLVALEDELLFDQVSRKAVGSPQLQTEQLRIQSLHGAAHGAVTV